MKYIILLALLLSGRAAHAQTIIVGPLQAQNRLSEIAAQGSAAQAAAQENLGIGSGGPYLPLSGGEIGGNLTVDGGFQMNGSGTVGAHGFDGHMIFNSSGGGIITLVPASTATFLTLTLPAENSTLLTQADLANAFPSATTSQFYGGSGAAGVADVLTQAQATALINIFSSTLSGAVPASGGGATNFLRADGAWAAPGGGGGGPPTGAAGGDLGGTYPDPTVALISTAALAIDASLLINNGNTITTTAGTTLSVSTGAAGSTTTAGPTLALTAGVGGSTSGAGGAVAVTGGNASTLGAGGEIDVTGGNGVGTGQNGGGVVIAGGTTSGANGGAVTITGGASGTGSGGNVTVATADSNGHGIGALTIKGGASATGAVSAGGVAITGGSNSAGGNGGGITLTGGSGAVSVGSIVGTAGSASALGGTGGAVHFTTGSDSSGTGGDFTVTLGTGGTRNGQLIAALPTTNPSVSNSIWSDSGFLVTGSPTFPSSVGLACANLPALTGDVTTASGSCATSVAQISTAALAIDASLLINNGNAITTTPGTALAVSTGAAGTTTSAGPLLSFTAGAGGSTSGTGGAISSTTGAGVGNNNGGAYTVTTGTTSGAASSGNILIQTGNGSGGASGSGSISLLTGIATSAGGPISLTTSNDSNPAGHSGAITLTTGSTNKVADTAGDIAFVGGSTSGGAVAANISLTVGTATGGGTNGNLKLVNIPTSNPSVSNAVWADAGVLVQGAPAFPLADLATIAANTMLGNWTGSTAAVAANAMPSCSAAGSALNYTSGTGIGCVTGLAAPLSGTTGSIGGGVLLAGACTSGTVSITGATTSMAVVATPVTYPGDGADWAGYVSSSNTVTVKVCALVAVTPSASTYNVRVIP